MRYPALVILTASLLAACQYDASHLPDTSPLKPVPVGSTLQLHQTLTIPADKVAVYLQGGRVARFADGIEARAARQGRRDGGFADVSVVNAHCKFEVYRRLDIEQTVRPDTFRITRVYQGEAHSASLVPQPVAEVRAGGGMRTSGGGSNSPSARTIVTVMSLQSASQPDVLRLSCGHVDDPGSDHLSIDQIRKVLGEVFTLRTGDVAK